jgi:hypothetical protein
MKRIVFKLKPSPPDPGKENQNQEWRDYAVKEYPKLPVWIHFADVARPRLTRTTVMRSYSLICIAILTITGCSDNSKPQQDKRVNGTGVVDYISYSAVDGLPHINVWAIKSNSLSALANLDLFSDFRPGLTFQDVANRHGQPSETRTLRNLTELRCYRGTNATLAVGMEPLRSSSPGNCLWTVWAFPGSVPLPVNAIAKQDILNQIEVPPAKFCLVLRESTPLQGSLWITVNSNAITEARWINGESKGVAGK